jgi:hypothetical protein
MQATKFNASQIKYSLQVAGNENFKTCEIFLYSGRNGYMTTQEGKNLKIKTDDQGNEYVELKGFSKFVVKADSVAK